MAKSRMTYFSVLFMMVIVLFVASNSDSSSINVQAASSAKVLMPEAISTSSSPFNGWLTLAGYPNFGYAQAVNTTEIDLPSTADGSFTLEASYKLSTKGYNYPGLSFDIPIFVKSGGYILGLERSCTTGYGWNCSDKIYYHLVGAGTAFYYKWPSQADQWYQIAMVYDGTAQQVSIYLDGAQIYTNPWSSTTGPGGSFNVNLSCIQNRCSDVVRLAGVDEVRISDVVRYTDSYPPATSPFTCDEHTRALWHFDEVEGSTVFHDACGTQDNFLTGYNGAHTEGVIAHMLYLPTIIH